MLMVNLLLFKSHSLAVCMMHVFFANCDVQKGYSTGKFKLFYKGLLPGHEGVPQLLLVDPAYPLFPYIMREFNHCTTNEQVVFNNMLRSARNQVECAFGRLKSQMEDPFTINRC